ncbi:MAG TPA: hemolysin family protein [Candidatus Dormibacteraeota bacterium]|nr:hemolysin family protein [Candidatus Dormibacteraeota bacterium]
MNLPLGELLVIVLLTLLEGFFVAGEIALVSIRRSRVEQLVDEGRPGARRVRRLLDEPGRFLAVSQLGLTVIGFFASAYAAVSLVESLRLLIAPIAGSSAQGIALVIVTILLALFTIVFAELVPKTLALANAERVAIALSLPIEFLARALSPLIALLTGITSTIAKVFGANVSNEAQITAEELRLIVERGGEQGVLEAEEEQMINAVIELGSRRVHEVMVPRIAMATIQATATFDEAIETIVEHGHSRIPVYDESVDEILGILYAKDLLPFLRESAGPRPDLRTLLRTPVYIPESMTVDDLLHEFQRRKVHLAIVLDEYGGTAGLVTIEDLLEEIVGEIQDEYDVEEPMIVRLSDDEARLDGRASVDDLAELFDTNLGLEDEDEYDTVGGLIYHRIGGVPTPGDRVEVDGLTLTVESTDGRRVGKVLAVRRRDENGGPTPDEDGDR